MALHHLSWQYRGQEKDPRTVLYFNSITVIHSTTFYQVFHSFYEEIKSSHPLISVYQKFPLSLSRDYSPDSKISSCCLCGGTNINGPGRLENQNLTILQWNRVLHPYLWDLASQDLNHWGKIVLASKENIHYPCGKPNMLGQRLYNLTTRETQYWGP